MDAHFEELFNDPEVAAYIDAAPRSWTYGELAARCLERFGRERAWSEARIKAYVLAWNRALRGKPLKVMRDAEVRAFVDARIGRLTYTELADACRARFGRERSPTRSSLHRYAVFLRAVYARP